MSTAPPLADIPPYQLQLLLSNVNELLGGPPASPGAPGPAAVTVCCAQALGTEIYVGCSNGSLLRYAFVDSLESSADSYQLLTHQSLPSGQPIDQIALAPSVERALVLCDNQIHFFALPNLEPVLQISPVRRVVTFALDESQQRKPLPDHRAHQATQPDAVRLCVIKRNVISVYTLRDRLIFQKEIPLPSGATLARLSNKHLCVADAATYNIIDIDTASLIPLIPLSQAADAPGAAVAPSITVVRESEFLLVSWTGASALGVFITGAGDPVRGTLAWATHPAALACDYPYVLAAQPDGTVSVQSLETQALCQTLAPAGGAAPARLATSFTGFVVPFGAQRQKTDVVDFPLLPPDTPDTGALEDGAATAQPRPRAGSPGAAPRRARPARQPAARVLAVDGDAVYALVRPALIQQADALLDAHKLQETARLAKEQQKALAQAQGADVEEQTAELHYVYQRLGYTCLAETRFEDAGNHLFRGDVDPRMLIRLFPALRGALPAALPAFAGLAPQLRALGTVDTLIVLNLVKNYSPHLPPSTRAAPPTSELRRLLAAAAREMLQGYLYKWKNKVRYGGEPAVKAVSEAIDTVLVKLLAERADTAELRALVEASEDVVLEEVEETLVRTGQYGALITLYRRRGDDGRLLAAWAKLADGEWLDDDVQDPLGQMTALLHERRDRALVQQWGLWLVKRDVEAGLKLLMSGDAKRGAKAEDAAMFEQLAGVSAEAGERFLEYLVLQKRSSDPALHTRLAHVCLGRLLATLQAAATLDYARETVLEYAIQGTATPFLVYLAEGAAASPQHAHVRARCEAALFLQGSALYDARAMRAELRGWEDVLGFEVAILDGKLGNHAAALRALVHTLRDTASADAYCALGGRPVPPKVAQALGARLALQPWAALGAEGAGARRARGTPRAELAQTRAQLLRVLLEVYMSGGAATERHAARLLNAQGGNLDVRDVVALVPPDWSLDVVSSFLTRAMRRTVHERCEGEILKAVCLGQNLEVRDKAYVLVRAQGAVIEEAAAGSPPPGGSGAGDAEAEAGEKAAFVPPDSAGEKVLLDEVRVTGDAAAEGPREGVGEVT